MEDYLSKRLNRILTVMSVADLAAHLNVSKKTIYNWVHDPGLIQARYINEIKALHVKLRSKINRRQQ